MIEQQVIDSGPALIKKFVYDLDVTDPYELFTLIGLVPPSPDGHEMELSLSKERREAVANLNPLIATYCTVAGGLMSLALSNFMKSMSHDYPNADSADHSRYFVEHLSYNLMLTLMAVMAGLHDMGVIRPIEIRYMTEEEMDEQ